MTITELRKILEELERKGEGNRVISIVSAGNCEPISEFLDKWTTDISVYIDEIDGTLTISD